MALHEGQMQEGSRLVRERWLMPGVDVGEMSSLSHPRHMARSARIP